MCATRPRMSPHLARNRCTPSIGTRPQRRLHSAGTLPHAQHGEVIRRRRLPHAEHSLAPGAHRPGGARLSFPSYLAGRLHSAPSLCGILSVCEYPLADFQSFPALGARFFGKTASAVSPHVSSQSVNSLKMTQDTRPSVSLDKQNPELARRCPRRAPSHLAGG